MLGKIPASFQDCWWWWTSLPCWLDFLAVCAWCCCLIAYLTHSKGASLRFPFGTGDPQGCRRLPDPMARSSYGHRRLVWFQSVGVCRLPFWYVSCFNFMTWQCWLSSAFWVASSAWSWCFLVGFPRWQLGRSAVTEITFFPCHPAERGSLPWGAPYLALGWAHDLPAHVVIPLPLGLLCMPGGCEPHCRCQASLQVEKNPGKEVKSTGTFWLHIKTFLPGLCCFAASKENCIFSVSSQISARVHAVPYPFHASCCAAQSKPHLGGTVLILDVLFPSACINQTGWWWCGEAQLYPLCSWVLSAAGFACLLAVYSKDSLEM